MKAIIERFASVCRADPLRPLLYLPATATTLTASQLADEARRYRELLTASGHQPGGLVACATGNRHGTIPLLLACWELGSPVLPVDVSTPFSETLALAARFCASRVIVPARAASGCAPALHALDDELVMIRREAATLMAYRDAALLKLTSGSTGTPKAVLVTAAQILADTDQIITAMGIDPDGVQIGVVPLSHAYGFGNLVMPLLVQGTPLVLRESFVPQQVTDDARRYGARAFHGVPFMYQHYIANPPADGWPPSLTLLVSAGARLEIGTIRQFHDRFGLKVHSFYGTTETGGIAFDGRDDLQELPTVGRRLAGVTIELRSDPAVPPDCGRIHVRGAAVSSGYAGTEGSSDLAAGGFLTGDYGYLTGTGELVLTGRVSTFVNVAGRKVQPDEVERVLREMPGVTDARVLAAPDEARGERIAAVVAGNGELTLASIRQYCARRLAAHKIPRLVIRVDEIPLTARGKTDHRALHALIEDHAGRTA